MIMKKGSTTSKIITAGVFLIIALAPLLATSEYMVHIGTLILLWAFVSSDWAYMARFGLVSLGHGVFLGIGAYIPVMLFNYYGVSLWLGMLAGVGAAVLVASILGYACFRLGLIGDYFALVTLAMAEVVILAIVACREVTGGSLGCTRKTSVGWASLQFDDKRYFYYIIFAFLLMALYMWRLIDKSRMRIALTAIEESELAASSMGVSIIRFKMGITLLSAGLTALGGVPYTQYVTYINPGTISGLGVSLSTCFKAILGGMFNIFGPLAGSAIMVSLEEYFRISFDTGFLGVSEIIFGVVLLVMIIFLPKGIVGSVSEWLNKRFGVARS